MTLFYQNLRKLFYGMALADEKTQQEETTKLINIVKKMLLH